MGYLRRALTGVFLMAMTFAALVWAGYLVYDAVAARMAADESALPNQETVYDVHAVTVTSGTERPTLETFGEIQARRAVDIRAGTPGRLTRLAPAMREGGRVSEGDVLARIDPAEAEAARASARADLNEADADLADARANVPLAEDDLAVAREQAELQLQALTRQRDLDTRGVGSVSAVETAALAAAQARALVVSRRQALAQAEARVDQAEARVERARIAVREAERQLADTEVTAPFDGTLADVAVAEGGLVAVNEVLARLVDPAALDVAARLSAGQYARLIGADGALRAARVTAILPSGDSTLKATGRIERDAAQVGEGRTGREVFAALDAAAGFKPGDIVTVRIEEPPLDNVARLPARAVSADGAVLVIGPDDRLEAARVAILRRQDDHVLVRAGDIEGAQVVARRRPDLGPGIRVRAVDGGAAAAGLETPSAAQDG